MSVETETPNEKLAQNLYIVANDLSELWGCFADTTIGFAGGGSLDGEIDPEEMSRTWVSDVTGLLEGCTITSEAEEDWGWMVVMLTDLSDALNLYWGPFWNELPNMEQLKTLIRMDMYARGLLEIFTRRGYTPADEPFIPPQQE